MNAKTSDLFINMLLKETYKFVPKEEASASNSSLEDYFNECEKNMKVIKGDILLMNFLEKNCQEIYPIKLNHKTSCYRVNFSSNILDFPKSWGEFGHLTQSLSEDKNLFCEILDQEIGLRDILLSIEKIDPSIRHYFLVNYKSDYYLVSVDNVDINYFRDWMTKYMGIDENIPFQFTDAA